MQSHIILSCIVRKNVLVLCCSWIMFSFQEKKSKSSLMDMGFYQIYLNISVLDRNIGDSSGSNGLPISKNFEGNRQKCGNISHQGIGVIKN